MNVIRKSDTGHVVPQLLDPTVSARKEGSQAGLVLCRRGSFGLLTVRSSELDPLWGRVTEAPKPRLGGGRVKPNEPPNWACTLSRPLGDWASLFLSLGHK